MTNNAVLQIQNINVSYSGVEVIRDVNLEVNAGEFFGLIGVNGAGKTTMIKTLLGLRDPDVGVVKVMGQTITQNTTSPHIAFLPERFEPSWFLTGLEFLKFSTQAYNAQWTDEQFMEYAQRLSLDPAALKRRVQTYSKGMRQKLGLLATVMTNSEVLILDEPMSGLDPAARTLVKDLLLEVKAAGRTIFLSSHILADMDEICDRICLLHESKIRFVGTPKQLKEETSAQNLERAFLHFIEEKSTA